MKKELKALISKATDITFTNHAEERLRIRQIPKEEILKRLHTLEKLIEIEDQGKEKGGHKLALFFSKSHKYDLKIVISIKGKKIKVITMHLQNIKKRKRLESWLKKLK